MKKRVLLLGTAFHAIVPLYFELKNNPNYEPFAVIENARLRGMKYEFNPFTNLPKLMDAYVIRRYNKSEVRRIMEWARPDIILLRCWTKGLQKLPFPDPIFWKIESVPPPRFDAPVITRTLHPTKRCVAFLAQNKEEVPFYKSVLDIPIGWFPRGVSHHWHKPMPKVMDVMVTGTASEKLKLMSYIKLAKPLCRNLPVGQIHVFQHYGRRNIPWAKDNFRPCYFVEDGPAKIASAKIFVSPIMPRCDRGVTSWKNLEGMACRTLVITQDHAGAEDVLGKEGENFICVRNPKECLAKVKYYLAHDKEREEISERAYKFVHSEYNYTKVFERAMKQIGVL